MDQFIVLPLLIAVFYFLLIRPQQKRAKDQQRLISSIGMGDQVVTIGGMFGTVTKLDDSSLWLEVSDGVQIRFARQSISRKIEDASSEEIEEAEEEPSKDPE